MLINALDQQLPYLHWKGLPPSLSSRVQSASATVIANVNTPPQVSNHIWKKVAEEAQDCCRQFLRDPWWVINKSLRENIFNSSPKTKEEMERVLHRLPFTVPPKRLWRALDEIPDRNSDQLTSFNVTLKKWFENTIYPSCCTWPGKTFLRAYKNKTAIKWRLAPKSKAFFSLGDVNTLFLVGKCYYRFCPISQKFASFKSYLYSWFNIKYFLVTEADRRHHNFTLHLDQRKQHPTFPAI